MKTVRYQVLEKPFLPRPQKSLYESVLGNTEPNMGLTQEFVCVLQKIPMAAFLICTISSVYTEGISKKNSYG